MSEIRITKKMFDNGSIKMPLEPKQVAFDLAKVLDDAGLHIPLKNRTAPENDRTAIRRIKLMQAQGNCDVAVRESARQFITQMLEIRRDWKVLYWDVRHTEVVIGLSL